MKVERGPRRRHANTETIAETRWRKKKKTPRVISNSVDEITHSFSSLLINCVRCPKESWSAGMWFRRIVLPWHVCSGNGRCQKNQRGYIRSGELDPWRWIGVLLQPFGPPLVVRFSHCSLIVTHLHRRFLVSASPKQSSAAMQNERGPN